MDDRAGGVIGFNDASDHLRARGVLASASYSEEGFRGLLGTQDLLALQELDMPLRYGVHAPGRRWTP